jgi:hypothetical protein
MTGAPAGSNTGGNCSSAASGCDRVMSSSMWVAAPGCACRCCRRGSFPAVPSLGIDESEQMLAVAAERAAERGWTNVRLVAAPVSEATIDVTADAAIFCAVHDVLQSAAALDNVFEQLRAGAPVAAIGGKWPGVWLWLLRPWVAELHRPFVRDFAGFDQPWRLLNRYVPDLEIQELAAGSGYLATGHARGPTLGSIGPDRAGRSADG